MNLHAAAANVQADASADIDTEVLVIGAGPVGLMLSNLLGMYGRNVTLVEQLPQLIDYPRGVGLDDESLRSIQTVGLSEQVLPHTTPQHIMRLVNGRGKVIMTNEPKADDFGWPRKNGFVQPLVDQALCDGLARFASVGVRFSHKVVDVAETAEHVVATVEYDDGGTTAVKRIRARYLVGCEGGKSGTRKRLGVSFEGKSPSTRWLVVDVNNDPLGTPNVFLGADPKRPYVSIGLAHAVRRWEFMLFDEETDEQVTDKKFIHRLLRDHVPDPGSLNVIRERVFTHHGRIAGSFRKGRQIIAGDAAHLMPVWMGQGWNSGVRDATNLAWKLATVLRGQASDALLDTYDVERRDHAKAMIDLSLTLGAVIKPTNPVVVGARDGIAAALNLFPQVKSYFSDMRFKPMPRYTEGVVVDPTHATPGKAAARLAGRLVPVLTANNRTSPVGVQFIQPRVNTRDAENVRLDDVVGKWWTVLAWGNNPRGMFTEEQLAKLEALGATFTAVVPETQRGWAEAAYPADVLVAGDVTGRLKKWFDDRPTPVLFLRPDRFVAGACLAQDAGRTLEAILASMSFIPAPAAQDARITVPAA
ncbi:bifunctional 3-(3-hydroxy-phenyl)propionate/3-hydroxycinnamic acid hydroxylase [Arthrobacter sp. GCM10027362]|uniref:bifunctional 3-(3-hydroxy-phenyl)propionate/3-hydroxycinnamic acid hydroxylase n=1 Tax=Arthrobacter sp. GCM10027362 TaxID=3273379 RepID=UPI00362C1250